MIRILAILLFLSMFVCASDCQAQRFRGWLNRGVRIQQQPAPQIDTVDQQNIDQRVPLRTTPRFLSRLYDPRLDPRNDFDNDIRNPYPKYIGGFHASQIHNLGTAPGDNGFRGNGIYWAPW